MDNTEIHTGIRLRRTNHASAKGNQVSAKTLYDQHEIIYGVDENPPWYACVLLGLQHYLLLIGSAIATPLISTSTMCIADDQLARSEIVSTQIFVSGIATFIQTTFGTRLPIVQGPSATFIAPTFAILSLEKWQCPDVPDIYKNVSFHEIPPGMNETYFQWRRNVWTTRMREIQGAYTLAAIVQVFVGLTGLVGFLLRFIGPLAVATGISLIGLSLYAVAADSSSDDWGIAMLTIFLIVLFSQYLRGVHVPLPYYTCGGGCSIKWSPIFTLFPVFLGIVIAWALCGILTVSGVLPEHNNATHYGARTDTNSFVLEEAPWFRFPYPGQWGLPTFSVAGVLGMLAGVLAGILESVGDYYACARLANAPPPPVHAMNRGVMFEGLGIIVSGLWGSGTGVTSYSGNVGAIGITKVGSRRVIQVLSLILLVVGVVGKFGAFFSTLPNPIIGGLFMVVFGLITAVGVSNLQYVDLNSSRNLFVFGFSVFFGFSVPAWLGRNKDAIATGVETLDQILKVLIETPMFVGSVMAIFLDNTIPGTQEERGITKWAQKTDYQDKELEDRVYGIPFCMDYLQKSSWAKYIPICPPFKPSNLRVHKRKNKENLQTLNIDNNNMETEMESSYVNIGADLGPSKNITAL